MRLSARAAGAVISLATIAALASAFCIPHHVKAARGDTSLSQEQPSLKEQQIVHVGDVERETNSTAASEDAQQSERELLRQRLVRRALGRFGDELATGLSKSLAANAAQDKTPVPHAAGDASLSLDGASSSRNAHPVAHYQDDRSAEVQGIEGRRFKSLRTLRLLKAQKLMQTRLQNWKEKQPRQNAEMDLDSWQKHHNALASDRAKVQAMLNSSRRADMIARVHAGEDLSEPQRPRNFIGLTDTELDMLQSHDPSRRDDLRSRVRRRIRRAEDKIKVSNSRTDVQDLHTKIEADVAWLELANLLTRAPGNAAQQLSAIMTAIKGMSSADAAKYVAALVLSIKTKAGLPPGRLLRLDDIVRFPSDSDIAALVREASSRNEVPTSQHSDAVEHRPSVAHTPIEHASAQLSSPATALHGQHSTAGEPLPHSSTRISSPTTSLHDLPAIASDAQANPIPSSPGSSIDSAGLWDRYLKELEENASTATSSSHAEPSFATPAHERFS